MGKLTKRFNQKARQGSLLDSSTGRKKNDELAKLVDVAGSPELEYRLEHDISNAFVVDPNERKKKKSKDFIENKQSKVLTKKQKKKLECMQARKIKERKRGDVLKSLSKHQVAPEQLSLFKSTSSIGKGSEKRKNYEIHDPVDVCDVANHNLNKKTKRKKKCNDDIGMEHDGDGIPLPPINVHISDDDYESDVLGDGLEEEHDADNHSGAEEPKDEHHCNTNNVKLYSGGSETNFTEEEVCENAPTSNCTIKTSQPSSIDTSELASSESKKVLVNVGEKEPDQSSNSGPDVPPRSEHVTPIYVTLQRSDEIQATRLLLPILPEEQVIMETVQENDVVIICGSTGSGKTTQVPQFLFEAGYGSHSSRPGIIGITEPRRVAAISMSKRVAEEMNLSTKKVSYQIRFEGNATMDTKIKFMTDGVLLKEMESDFLLSKYSVIIIDEAHERSVYTDILIGMLTRIVPLRKKRGSLLKLIIMSATLRIEDFTENNLLFPKPPPVLKVDSRQYPVTIHFNRKTNEDYITESFKKICKIHQSFKLDGGILVFLTGQREVLSLCSKLKKAFPKKGYNPVQLSNLENNDKEDNSGILPKIDLDTYEIPCCGTREFEDDVDQYSSGDEECTVGTCEKEDPLMTNYAPLFILPLYSLLPTSEQSKVFSKVPDGHRLCVLSTNVAETSLTIPGIKYIIDSGKVKSKFFDKVTGVSKFMITWTSKASANQRAGRAGRVGPGHCYRLYSSAVFENNFDEYLEPEIKRRPVDDLVLQMKNMHIDKVIQFPFPSPPDQTALKSAEKLLLDLGALKNSKTKQSQDLATITPLGKHLSKIPISPRFAKMIYLSCKNGCVKYVVTIAAALAVRNIFTDDIDISDIADVDDDDFKKKKIMITKARRKWAGNGPSSDLGDLMVILRAVGASEYANCVETFCKSNGLRLKSLTEIRKLRTQLLSSLNDILDEKISIDLKMNPPTNEEAQFIRQIILSCFGDHVARKVPPEQAKSLKLKNAYQSYSLEDMVYIHPTSSMFTKLPEYVVYHEIVETKKLYMKTLFSINEEWLPLHSSQRCILGKPLDEPAPIFDENEGNVKCYMSSTYGPHMWPLPPQRLGYPNCPEKYRWFAKFFLEGVVCEKLKQFSSHLITPPTVMLKSSHLQQKTEDLLCCFMEKEVNDKRKLFSEWKKNPKYALFHYLKWLPDSQHDFVKFIWPPVE